VDCATDFSGVSNTPTVAVSTIVAVAMERKGSRERGIEAPFERCVPGSISSTPARQRSDRCSRGSTQLRSARLRSMGSGSRQRRWLTGLCRPAQHALRCFHVRLLHGRDGFLLSRIVEWLGRRIGNIRLLLAPARPAGSVILPQPTAETEMPGILSLNRHPRHAHRARKGAGPIQSAAGSSSAKSASPAYRRCPPPKTTR
jgi:hypothetical protein